jgi:hypothetical protein
MHKTEKKGSLPPGRGRFSGGSPPPTGATATGCPPWPPSSAGPFCPARTVSPIAPAPPGTVARGGVGRLDVSHETFRLSGIWTFILRPLGGPHPYSELRKPPPEAPIAPSPTSQGGTRAAAQGRGAPPPRTATRRRGSRRAWRARRGAHLARREHGCILSPRWADVTPQAPPPQGPRAHRLPAWADGWSAPARVGQPMEACRQA